MLKKQQFQFTKITVDEVFLWLKNKIKQGKFSQYSDYSDKELYEIARVCKPLIEINLETLGEIALEQLNNSEKTALVKSKAPLPLTQS